MQFLQHRTRINPRLNEMTTRALADKCVTYKLYFFFLNDWHIIYYNLSKNFVLSLTLIEAFLWSCHRMRLECPEKTNVYDLWTANHAPCRRHGSNLSPPLVSGQSVNYGPSLCRCLSHLKRVRVNIERNSTNKQASQQTNIKINSEKKMENKPKNNKKKTYLTNKWLDRYPLLMSMFHQARSGK